MSGVQRVDDATLPAPWQALFDPSSRLKYYWNPTTNVTTYDRPGGAAAAAPSAAPASGGDYYSSRDRREEPAAAANGGGYASTSYQKTGMTGQPVSTEGFATSADYRRTHGIIVQGDHVPDSLQTFESVGFPPDILDEIRRAGFKSPTPIQAQAWPIALSGRDLVAIAKTGSGKTCGFLLPGMLHIQATRKDARVGPTLLCLAPTRELAMQIKAEADKFGRSSGIRNTAVYGGAPKGPQLRDIQNGVQIMIATPGRLNDFLEAGQVRLQQRGFRQQPEGASCRALETEAWRPWLPLPAGGGGARGGCYAAAYMRRRRAAVPTWSERAWMTLGGGGGEAGGVRSGGGRGGRGGGDGRRAGGGDWVGCGERVRGRDGIGGGDGFGGGCGKGGGDRVGGRGRRGGGDGEGGGGLAFGGGGLAFGAWEAVNGEVAKGVEMTAAAAETGA
ncbi:DEAD-box ATP-dependent RNA helicase 14 [Tetrabaena socialis]|uniref:DEAD-box ATP-dependent RNA helicase 14 n=1 Tax=Tetrabaena socialis TaxID=47790 RepID=A0A2J7ZXN8_9CHLO|nr:DEAD-box ATP-dependent RNA helicase 14 [Tetrabaena socialis]|eukprot:PNH05034.1 DEAD-box ATP-dependent RNA helicase 14 [Tetrabaena socialis]